MTRQSLLRAWGQFQEGHPLIVAPIYTGVPFEAGTDLAEGRVAQTIRACAWPSPSTPWACPPWRCRWAPGRACLNLCR
jgi:hypothetical protein